MATKGPANQAPVIALDLNTVLTLRGGLRKVGFKKEDPKFNAAVTNNVAEQVKSLPVQTVQAPVAAQPKVQAPVAAPVAPIVPAIPKAPVGKAPVKQPMNPLNKGRALPATPTPKRAPTPPPRDDIEVSPVAPRRAPTPPPRSPIAAHIEVAPVAPTMAPTPPPPPPVAVAITKTPAARTALLDSIRAADTKKLKHVAAPVAPAVRTTAVVVTPVAAPVDATRNRANTAPIVAGFSVSGMDMNAIRQGLKKRPGTFK